MQSSRCIFALILSFLFINTSRCQTGEKQRNVIQQENKLAGTWRLIEFADLDSKTGMWTYRYGKNPRGFFTYTKNFIVNINISAEEPLKIPADSNENYTVKLYDYLWNNSLGYL